MNMISPLLALRIKFAYRNRVHLNDKTIFFISLTNACVWMNAIINTYHRYQVHFNFVIGVNLSLLKHYSCYTKAILFRPTPSP